MVIWVCTVKENINCFQASGWSHLDVGAARHLDPVTAVPNDVVLHDLPAATETDAMTAVFIDAVATELHAAVFLHSDATAPVSKDAVRNQPGQLAALQHGDAGAAVAVHEVGEDVQGLAALHVQTHRYGARERDVR